MDAWVEHDLALVELGDMPVKTRLGHLLGDLGERMGQTLPMACQDWPATKAAYRSFDNPRVDDQAILAGHVAATAGGFSATKGTILVLHDTTEFSFTRNTADGVGWLSFVKGWYKTHTACGCSCTPVWRSQRMACRLVWRLSSSRSERGLRA